MAHNLQEAIEMARMKVDKKVSKSVGNMRPFGKDGSKTKPPAAQDLESPAPFGADEAADGALEDGHGRSKGSL